MKTITATELKSILDQHQLWIESAGKQGQRAILTGAYLRGANLTGANLTGANLTGADLTDANLTNANLSDADLHAANLHAANLEGANLRGANLTRANLTGAILTGTILENKAEKQPEVVSVKAESSIRSEIEAIAKKHGMKVDSIALSFL